MVCFLVAPAFVQRVRVAAFPHIYESRARGKATSTRRERVRVVCVYTKHVRMFRKRVTNRVRTNDVHTWKLRFDVFDSG